MVPLYDHVMQPLVLRNLVLQTVKLLRDQALSMKMIPSTSITTRSLGSQRMKFPLYLQN
jgi:hypothetical protein